MRLIPALLVLSMAASCGMGSGTGGGTGSAGRPKRSASAPLVALLDPGSGELTLCGGAAGAASRQLGMDAHLTPGCWSPDGETLAFVRRAAQAQYVLQDRQETLLMARGPDFDEPTVALLAPAPWGRIEALSWDPLGEGLLVTCKYHRPISDHDVGPWRTTWLVDTREPTVPAERIPLLDDAVSPSWRYADGAVAAAWGEQVRLFRSLSGGAAGTIDAGGEVQRLSWSASGRYIVAATRQRQQYHLAAHDVASGEGKTLGVLSGRAPGLLGFVVAPYRDEVAYVDDQGRLRLAGLCGAEPRTLSPRADRWDTPSWLADGESVTFNQVGDDRTGPTRVERSGAAAPFPVPAALNSVSEARWAPQERSVEDAL